MLLLISGCSGSGIGTQSENPEQYFGCYFYNRAPVLIIEKTRIYNIGQHGYNKVNGFLKIRNSYFILTKNQMIFNKDGELRFTLKNSGFQYEFENKTSPPNLMLYDEMGNLFKLTRDGAACRHHRSQDLG